MVNATKVLQMHTYESYITVVLFLLTLHYDTCDVSIYVMHEEHWCEILWYIQKSDNRHNKTWRLDISDMVNISFVCSEKN